MESEKRGIGLVKIRYSRTATRKALDMSATVD